MDENSMRLMRYFKDNYLFDMEGFSILDIGSRRVNKQPWDYRSIFEPNYKYTGMDIVAGLNVDIVGYENIIKRYDVVISGQVMEHVERPWEWLKDLIPYFKKYICIIAPWTAREHRHPIDTFRFLPDGMRILFKDAGIKDLEIIKDASLVMGIGEKEK